jgi:Tfp pilus assembly protein PilO
MNRRERLLLMVAIVLLGGIGFKFLIHDPHQAEYNTLVTARDAAADELARDERIVARAPQARAEYERVRAHIAAVEQKLPQRKEIPALLTAMEQFTKQVGVTLMSLRPGPLTAITPAAASQTPTGARPSTAAQTSTAGGPGQGPAGAGTARSGHAPAYSSMPVEIALEGTFAQTVEYLRNLNSIPRLVIVDSVALTPLAFPKLGVSIRAEIYTLGTPSTPAGGTR